jgi:two-component system, OmpR family, sensor kinase
MSRSFRFQLALRFALAMAAGLAVVGLLSFLALRETLDREIEATLLGVASIQAGSATEPDEGHMRLLEWELSPEEAEALRDLNRFTQIWGEDGRSLLRTRYLTEDLPLDTAALRGAVAGELVWTEQEFQGTPVRSLFYPLGRFGPEHEAHVLQVAAPLESRNRMLRGVAFFVSLVVVTVSVGSFGGAWWLADRALRPVHRLTDQAEEIGAGTLGRRITAHTETQEYQHLVEVLNGMLARIDEAFEAQKRFTADASHELRSPLTALRGEMEVALRRERSPEEYRRVLASGLEEVERLSRTAEDLLTLARSDAGVMEPRLRSVDLGQVVGSVTERLRKLGEGKGVRLSAELTSGVEVLADADLLDRLAWNLVENAVKFTPAGGSIEVLVHRDGGRAPTLEVRDSGPGLDENDMERIFERFSRGDSARARSSDTPGTGLGLAIARAIANVHGAELTVANRPEGNGALSRVRFRDRPASTPVPADSFKGRARSRL